MKTMVRSVAAALALVTPGVAGGQSALSDEFDDPGTLSDWSRFHATEGWPDMMERLEITGDGHLLMEPHTSGWYADYHAPFLYKEVAGDFAVTTRILVSGKRGESPRALWSLSGLMVRAPREITAESWQPRGESWLFLTTGVADDLDQPVFETKTTRYSRSRLRLHPNRLGWVELRIVRSGERFSLSYRYPDEAWTPIEEFVRSDLPDVLQVGLNAYTDFYSADEELMEDVRRYNSTVVTYGSPDLRVLVDYVRFEQPGG